jgi:hypothetical protein
VAHDLLGRALPISKVHPLASIATTQGLYGDHRAGVVFRGLGRFSPKPRPAAGHRTWQSNLATIQFSGTNAGRDVTCRA